MAPALEHLITGSLVVPVSTPVKRLIGTFREILDENSQETGPHAPEDGSPRTSLHHIDGIIYLPKIDWTCTKTPSPSCAHRRILSAEVEQLCSDLHGAKCRIDALEDAQDVNNGQLALVSFQVERSRCQLTHYEKKQKSTHRLKLTVEGEVITHDDFLDCVNRAEAVKMAKEAQKVANKDRCMQGKRVAAAKGASATHRTQAWEVAKQQNDAAKLHWKDESACCLKEGHALPKKPEPLKRKDVWAALGSAGSIPGMDGGSGPTLDNEGSSESSDEDNI
ncbi:hypothetical protein BS47DRAFT_1399932 [Hydnum rufescens UP504]|uniref:Uncharacterized protein n=1 Tax=Hydnum rufescens UP504 TaxID=1448309 RepID=A0A9P6AIK3_9AGAM|nr:hypothetical protein BS47DRAFT_1399932 [Hydnum rufescens UP504]